MCLISVFGELIINSVNVVLKHKTDKFKIEIENAMNHIGKKNTKDDEGTPATKDDVR